MDKSVLGLRKRGAESKSLSMHHGHQVQGLWTLTSLSGGVRGRCIKSIRTGSISEAINGRFESLNFEQESDAVTNPSE